MNPHLPALLTVPMLALAPRPSASADPPYSPDVSSCIRSSPTIVVTGADPELVTGTEGDDVVFVSGGTHGVRTLGGDDSVCVYRATLTDADLGRGDDELVVLDDQAGKRSARLSGGTGRDRIVALYDADVRLDLGRGTLRGTSGSGSGRFRVAGLEDASVSAHRAVVLGDDGANDISSHACTATLAGGGGRDTVRALALARLADFDPTPRCQGSFRFLGRGGPGDDKLFGRRYDETLVGGKGRDLADGKQGTDRCDAEVERHCE